MGQLSGTLIGGLANFCVMYMQPTSGHRRTKPCYCGATPMLCWLNYFNQITVAKLRGTMVRGFYFLKTFLECLHAD